MLTDTDSVTTTEREIILTRLFDAPRDLVFRVWSVLEHLSQWWGPRGFTTTTQKMEFKEDGVWRFCMHGPDGRDYENKITFREIVPLERIVYQHGGDKDVEPVSFTSTASFAEEGGQTRVTLSMRFPSATALKHVVNTYGAIEGGKQHLARLGEYLDSLVSGKRRFTLTRTFDVPRHIVFRAWVEPERLARWWGPQNFSNPVCELDVRPAGAIRIDMRGPDGTVYPMRGVFHEIIEPQWLAFTCTAKPDARGKDQLEVMNRVTFAEQEGRTTVTVQAVIEKAAPEAAGAIAGMEAGWMQSLDRLAEVAKPEPPAASPFVIARVFEAPREQVFKVWTEAEHLQHWFGPKGFAATLNRFEMRAGGVCHYCLRGPNGAEMWGKWVIREIHASRRLVFVSSFSDPEGHVTRAFFNPHWPLHTLSTILFAEYEGRTILTIQWEPINATPAEREAFEASLDALSKGWAGTFEQLSEYLKKC